MAFSRLRSLIPAGDFGRGVAVLAGGTAFGQALTILASPVLTRLYGPADFGVLAVYTSIIGIAGALAALSYHQAIPLPEEDADAAQVLGLSLVSTLLVAVLVAVAVALGGSRLAIFLDAPALVPYLWMIPLGVLGLSAYEVLTQWAVRRKAFPAIARTAVARGAAQTGTQLGLGFAGLGSFGLLLGQLFAQWVGSGSLLRRAVVESGPALRSVNPAGMRAAASRWRRFPQYTGPSVFLSAAGANAPALLLSYFFGGAVTGFYALGSRLLSMPVALVAKSASHVFLASAPGYIREKRLGVEVGLVFARMLRLALTPTLVLAIAAPALFSVVFGDDWRESGVYVRWLTPWLLTAFVGFALTPLVSVLEKQRAGLVFQGVLSLARVAALAIGGLLGNALLAIALFGLANGVCWTVYVVWLLRVGEASLLASGWLVSRELMWSLPFAVPTAGCVALGTPDWLTAGIGAVCILAGVAVMSMRSQERDESARV